MGPHLALVREICSHHRAAWVTHACTHTLQLPKQWMHHQVYWPWRLAGCPGQGSDWGRHADSSIAGLVHSLGQDLALGALDQAPEMWVLNDCQGKRTARASWTARAVAPEEENNFLVFEKLGLLLSSLQSPQNRLRKYKDCDYYTKRTEGKCWLIRESYCQNAILTCSSTEQAQLLLTAEDCELQKSFIS